MKNETNSHIVVGNPNYIITNKFEVKRVDGNPLDLPETKTEISIPIYGYFKKVKKEWLYWLSFFKLELLPKYQKYVFNYDFKENGTLEHMKKDPKIVIFKEPVYVEENKQFRIIPRFPNYAIRFNGQLLNVKFMSYGTNSDVKFIGNYRFTNLTDQSGRYLTNTFITHRLVALTWVENDDFVSKPIVDHLDGNKANCHYTNLEWVSYGENNKRAVNTGLRKDNYKLEAKNIDTEETFKFHSMTDLVNFIGRSRINSVTNDFTPGKIWKGTKGRFEIRKIEKNLQPWSFKKDTDIREKTNLSIEFINNNNETTLFHDVMSIRKQVLNKSGRKSLKDTIKEIKKLYPDSTINVTIFETIDGYEARDINTKEVFKAKTCKLLSEKIGIGKSTVQKYSKLDESKVINGYQIRQATDKQWKDPVIDNNVNSNIQVEITDKDTDKTIKFDSLRKSAEYLKVDKKTIKLIADEKKLLFGKYYINFI